MHCAALINKNVVNAGNKVHMNFFENCQSRYCSNSPMGSACTDGPDEFEPSKFFCSSNMLYISLNICFGCSKEPSH